MMETKDDWSGQKIQQPAKQVWLRNILLLPKDMVAATDPSRGGQTILEWDFGSEKVLGAKERKSCQREERENPTK